MNESQVRSLLMDIPMVLCRNMNNRFVSTIIKSMELDLSHHHFMILRTLYERSQMHSMELVEYLGITKPQMTASIDRLVDLSLVERVHDAKDRRKIGILLTREGKETTKKVLKQIEKKLTDGLKDLTEEEIIKMGEGIQVLFKMCIPYEANKP